MIRFDVPLGRTEWTNLPTIGPLTSIDEARAKVTEAIKAVLGRGIGLNELSIVVHHFIAARASAWSEAQPGLPSIRIDATWGLPDGLQTFVHDSIVCDLASGTFVPHVRYKDRFIDIDRTGSWITRKAYPALAQELACGHRVAREIAEITTRVADATGRPVRIMWFLDVLQGGGGATPEAMPWIVVEVENGSGLLPPWTTAQPSGEALRRLADLHRRKAVTNRTTLALFRRNPSAADIGGRHVLLQPDASAVRDRQFLATFADVVRGLPNQWKVLYAGSMLAHTPYQLQQLGVGVLPLHAEVRTPRRTYSRKLVRDGIPSRIAAGGEHAEVVPLDVDQYRLALRQKLVEEALEVAYAGDAYELREELADLLEVAKAIVTASELKGWGEVEDGRGGEEKAQGRLRSALIPEGFRLRQGWNGDEPRWRSHTAPQESRRRADSTCSSTPLAGKGASLPVCPAGLRNRCAVSRARGRHLGSAACRRRSRAIWYAAVVVRLSGSANLSTRQLQSHPHFLPGPKNAVA